MNGLDEVLLRSPCRKLGLYFLVPRVRYPFAIEIHKSQEVVPLQWVWLEDRWRLRARRSKVWETAVLQFPLAMMAPHSEDLVEKYGPLVGWQHRSEVAKSPCSEESVVRSPVVEKRSSPVLAFL